MAELDPREISPTTMTCSQIWPWCIMFFWTGFQVPYKLDAVISVFFLEFTLKFYFSFWYIPYQKRQHFLVWSTCKRCKSSTPAPCPPFKQPTGTHRRTPPETPQIRPGGFRTLRSNRAGQCIDGLWLGYQGESMTRMMDIPRRIPLVGEMYRCIFVNTCSPSKKKHGCFFFGGGEVKDIYIYIIYACSKAQHFGVCIKRVEANP